MYRSARPRRWLASLSFVLALGAIGCSAEEGTPNVNVTRPPTQLAVHVTLSAQNTANVVSVTATTRATGTPETPLGDETLHFAFRDDAGNVLADGDVNDPRHVHAETFVDGTAARDEAMQSFASVVVQLPAHRGTLVFTDATGTRVGAVDVEPPANAAPPGSVVQQLISPETDIIGSPVKVVDHGSSDRAYDLLFLPEGYTDADLPRFADDVNRVVSQLFERADWGRHAHRINVWRIDVRSAESGVSEASPAVLKNTAFAIRRDARINRLLVAGDRRGMAAATELGARVHADRIVIITNSGYGGAGGEIPVAANDASLPGVVAHELGHSILHLADEYYNPTTPERSDAECASARPGGPNVSDTADRTALPWRDLVSSSTPLPTTDLSSSAVGAYLGGDRCATHRYRPTPNCLMNTNLADQFCPVCQREMDRYFAQFPGGLATTTGTDGGTTSDGGTTGSDAGTDASIDPVPDMNACEYWCDSLGYATGQCVQGWYCDGRCITFNGCIEGDTAGGSSGGSSSDAGTGTGSGSTCEYTCESLGYAPGQCVSGWYCDGTCIVNNGCY